MKIRRWLVEWAPPRDLSMPNADNLPILEVNHRPEDSYRKAYSIRWLTQTTFLVWGEDLDPKVMWSLNGAKEIIDDPQEDQ